MKFLLDENLPPRMARILNELEDESPHQVLHLAADLGLQGVADVDWFEKLAQDQEWVIITHDSGIRKNPHELAAWTSQGHIVLFLARGWQHQSFQEQAWRLMRWWPALVKVAERAKGGDAYIVPFQGSPSKVEKLDPRHRKRKRRRSRTLTRR